MKKEIKTGLTKEKILKAAINEFGVNGYSGSSINNICNGGIAKGLIYHNFSNKDTLYLACVERIYQKFISYISALDIGSNFQKYIDGRLQFFRENEQEARIFFETILHPPANLIKEITDLRFEFDELNRKIYKQILMEVTLRDGVSEKDAMNYFTMIQNVFNVYFNSSSYNGMPFLDKMRAHEEELSKILDYMLNGIIKKEVD